MVRALILLVAIGLAGCVVEPYHHGGYRGQGYGYYQGGHGYGGYGGGYGYGGYGYGGYGGYGYRGGDGRY